MSHHTVSHHNDFLESAEDLTDLFCREPPYVAAAWDERSIEADTTAAGIGIEEGGSIRAERSEREM